MTKEQDCEEIFTDGTVCLADLLQVFVENEGYEFENSDEVIEYLSPSEVTLSEGGSNSLTFDTRTSGLYIEDVEFELRREVKHP